MPLTWETLRQGQFDDHQQRPAPQVHSVRPSRVQGQKNSSTLCAALPIRDKESSALRNTLLGVILLNRTWGIQKYTRKDVRPLNRGCGEQTEEPPNHQLATDVQEASKRKILFSARCKQTAENKTWHREEKKGLRAATQRTKRRL